MTVTEAQQKLIDLRAQIDAFVPQAANLSPNADEAIILATDAASKALAAVQTLLHKIG